MRPTPRILVLLPILTLAAVVLVGAPATNAHAPGFSSVRLDIGESSVVADLSVPLDLLGESVGLDLVDATDTVTADNERAIADYFESTVSILSTEGEWEPVVNELTFVRLVDDEHLDTSITFDAPGGTVGEFELVYDVIIDRADDHEVLVGITTIDDGFVSGGTLTSERNMLRIAEDGSAEISRAGAFFDVAVLGFEHVVEGADHILFLLVLVLPAPLLAAGNRWGERASIQHLFTHVLGVSTAFFIGHSVTLVLSTVDWVSAPMRPVEILIAASIAVGAIHAIRPIIRRGEVAIAGIFGLVHGLAFAELFDELALGEGPELLQLLGFNVGVELAQLAAIGLVLPGQILLSRTSHYQRVRVAAAIFSLGAAAGWAGERVGWFTNPLGPVEDTVIEHPLITIAAFTGAALALRVISGTETTTDS